MCHNFWIKNSIVRLVVLHERRRFITIKIFQKESINREGYSVNNEKKKNCQQLFKRTDSQPVVINDYQSEWLTQCRGTIILLTDMRMYIAQPTKKENWFNENNKNKDYLHRLIQGFHLISALNHIEWQYVYTIKTNCCRTKKLVGGKMLTGLLKTVVFSLFLLAISVTR